MLATDLLSNPAVVALIVALPSVTIAYFGYKRARRVDDVAEQAGLADDESRGVDQVIEGLNKLVGNLQVDNEVQRRLVISLDEKLVSANEKLTTALQQLSTALHEIEALRAEVRELNDRIPAAP